MVDSMRVVGIIAEYNPFHNGHLYHMEQAKQLVSADAVVCVMSGNFIQRGEPAIVDKWSRAKMALACGADLVLELPVVYAMSSAEFFAFGGIKILDSLGIVDAVCFGSELGDIQKLNMIAEILVNEPEAYRLALKNELKKGLSYPRARENALIPYLEQIGGTGTVTCEELKSIIQMPNNILAIEYLKAIKKLQSKITPYAVKRIKSSHNSDKINGRISSATSIRKYIMEKYKRVEGNCIPEETMPPASKKILEEELNSGRGPVFSDNFESIILATVRKMSQDELRLHPYISEGMENRLKTFADKSGTLEEMIGNISTKRYPKTRIKRGLFAILIGLKETEFNLFNLNGGPQYIRVLGFNSKGRQLLSLMNKTASLPVIVKTANFKNTPNFLLNRMLEIESRSTDIYVLGYSNPGFRSSGQEYTRNPVIIE